MAGIKIQISRTDTNPNAPEYVEVAKQIFGSAANLDPLFDDLADFTSSEIVNFLNDGGRYVTIDDNDKRLRVRNTVVSARYDDLKRNRRGKIRATLNLPKDNPPNLGYLQPYINVLNDPNMSNTDKQYFLMGVLVLTKCR